MQLPFRGKDADEQTSTDDNNSNTSVSDDDDTVSAVTQAGNSHVIPFILTEVPLAKKFIQRPEETSKIYEALMPTTTGRKTFVLRGLGGIGKTSLAVNFARAYNKEFSAVVWLDARSESSLKQSLASFACRLPNLQDQPLDSKENQEFLSRRTLAWLSEQNNTNWLLIIDGIDVTNDTQTTDVRGYDIKQYLPEADHGSILITTRLTRLEQLGTSTEVQKVDEQTAREMLSSWLSGVQEDDECMRLLEHLDGLPLAIAQAGAYMNETGVTLKTYLRLYETHWTTVAKSLDESESPLEDYQNRSVWTTWVISFDAVRLKSNNAANLLVLWSYFANRDFWFGLFSQIAQATSVIDQLKIRIGDCASDETQFIEAMAVLRSYSLINVLESGYSMHPVVHEWTFHYLGKPRMQDYGHLALTIIGLGDVANPFENYTLNQKLLRHAHQCLNRCSPILMQGEVKKNITASQSTRSIATAIIMAYSGMGRIFRNDAMVVEENKMYSLALEGYTEHHGPKNPKTLAAMSCLAMSLDIGRFAVEAKTLLLTAYRESIQLKDKKFISVVANNLGFIYYSQSQLQEAAKMYEESLNADFELNGGTDLLIHRTKSNLANVYREMSKFDEAEKLSLEVIEMRRKMFGPENHLTLFSIADLGRIYIGQGKYNEAEQCLLQALSTSERMYGRDHPWSLHIMTFLGMAYVDQKRWSMAGPIFFEILKGQQKAFGPNHSVILTAKNNLAVVLMNRNKLEDAEKFILQVLQVREKTLDKSHVDVLTTVLNLGMLYRAQGKMAEAEDAYQRALDGFKQTFGENHERCALATRNLAQLYKDQSRFEEADIMIQRTLGIYAAILGDDGKYSHPIVLKLYQASGWIHIKMDSKPEIPRALYMEALRGVQATEDENSKGYLETKRVIDILDGIIADGKTKDGSSGEIKLTLHQACLQRLRECTSSASTADQSETTSKQL